MLKSNINLNNSTVLVTGAAGFIGANLVLGLLNSFDGICVIGIDNLNDYYDVMIKDYRLLEIEKKVSSKKNCQWVFLKGDITDRVFVDTVFQEYNPKIVVNLAAQAGVRYSILNPDVFIASNLIGFYNILEACRNNQVEHFVYASSSSVYGDNQKVPYAVEDKTDKPVYLYDATKKSNELLAFSYSKQYNISTTGLRFFTVYGPAGRPDMAYFLFTNKLVNGENIQIFNYGNCSRDFTYVDDVVEGIMLAMQHAPEKKMGHDGLPISPYKIYNIGKGSPEKLLDFVEILQRELLRAAMLPKDYDFDLHKVFLPMQVGDVPVTYADTSTMVEDFNFKPSITLQEGLRKFVEWYKKYYERN